MKEKKINNADLCEDELDCSETKECSEASSLVRICSVKNFEENNLTENIERGISVGVLRNQNVGLYRETNVFQGKEYQNYFYYDVEKKLPEKREKMSNKTPSDGNQTTIHVTKT